MVRLAVGISCFCLAIILPRPVGGVVNALSRPASVLKAPLDRVRRSRKLLAHNGWSAGVDQITGATYYINENTGQSQWEPPYQAQQPNYGAPPGFSAVTGLWRVEGFAGVTGFDFIMDGRVIPVENAPFTGLMHGTVQQKHSVLPYELLNGDEVVLSRWNMLQQILTVSRMQCAVKCLDDGTAILISCGRGPTLFRGYESGGNWVALQQGESLGLSDGDQVSLDCNNPEGAVFTCHDGSAMQQQGGYQQQHQQQQGGYQQQPGGYYPQQGGY